MMKQMILDTRPKGILRNLIRVKARVNKVAAGRSCPMTKMLKGRDIAPTTMLAMTFPTDQVRTPTGMILMTEV